MKGADEATELQNLKLKGYNSGWSMESKSKYILCPAYILASCKLTVQNIKF